MTTIVDRTARSWRAQAACGVRFVAAAVLAASSSCATSTVTSLNPPRQPHTAAAPRTPPAPFADRQIEHAVVQEYSPGVRGIQPLAYLPPGDGDVATARTGDVTATGFEAHSMPGAGHVAAIAHTAEPRMPLPHADMPAAFAVPFDEPPYPEELLCDGGDSGYPFHYENGEPAGLEPDDTVAEFVDHTGAAGIRVSTRACVYAPKFGAVRSVSQPVLRSSIQKLGGAHAGDLAAGMDAELRLDVRQHVDQAVAARVRDRAGQLDLQMTESDVHQALSAEQHVKIVNAGEQRGALSEGQLQRSQQAQVALLLHIAGESIEIARPIIVAHDQFGQAVTSAEYAAEYVVAEDRRPRGELRIVKLADQAVAQPGDVITFRIRFYNDGGRELREVRILDHLSPRLEYLEGSAVSELEGRLLFEADDSGGQILQFELEAPLPGGASGEITFQARAK